MKTLKYTLFIYIAIVSTLVSCNKENDFLNEQDLSAQPIIEVSITGFETDSPATRATDDEDAFKTTLIANDQIGIYAVKNGRVISKNIPYTYDGSAWNKVGEAVSVVPGDNVSYFAYYPYRQAMDSKDIKSIDDIVTHFEVATDQSTHELYTQNDLMTAIGTLTDKTLSFTLNHALALIVVDLKGKRTPYVGGYTVYGAVSAISSKTIGTVATPYQDAKGCFRALVKPGSVTPNISYSSEGQTVTYTKAITASAGKYSRKLIYAGGKTSEQPISRGDYFYADGNISSTYTNDSSNPCIGIVLTTDQCLDAAPYNHGLVVALKDVANKIKYAWQFWNEISNIPSVPSTCKKWFLPSDEQLLLMIWGNTSTQSLDGKAFLEEKMKGVANSENFNARNIGQEFYSSTEADYMTQWAIVINTGERKQWVNGAGANARGILAF